MWIKIGQSDLTGKGQLDREAQRLKKGISNPPFFKMQLIPINVLLLKHQLI